MFVANPTVGAATSVFLDDDWLIGRRYTQVPYMERKVELRWRWAPVGSYECFFACCIFGRGGVCVLFFLRFETICARWWRKMRETIDLIVDTCQALSAGIRESDPPEDAQRRSLNLRAVLN